MCKKWRLLVYDFRLWKSVFLRLEYGGLYVYNVDVLFILIGIRFGVIMKYIEFSCEFIILFVLYDFVNKCSNLVYMILDFVNVM